MNKNIYKTFPAIVHPIRWPGGETEESLFNYLKGFRLDGSASNELENYPKLEVHSSLDSELNKLPGRFFINPR